jgi:hypothetical protein
MIVGCHTAQPLGKRLIGTITDYQMVQHPNVPHVFLREATREEWEAANRAEGVEPPIPPAGAHFYEISVD